jgi:hypothetical protein
MSYFIKKISLYVFILILSFNILIAQQTSPYSLNGNVFNKEKTAINFAQIFILSTDSTLLNTANIVTGRFEIYPILADTVIVKIMALGYQPYVSKFIRPNAGELFTLENIQLINNLTLKTVSIKNKVPLFETNGTGTIINVEKTSLNSAGSVLDVLRKSPGIIVNSNDEVQVLGKGKPLIFLDGALITSIEMLKSISSTDVKKIEIIRTPSAKYDAEGNAIIEIFTTKNSTQGYNGQLIQNTLYLRYIYSVSGIRLNVNQRKWNSNFSYSNTNGQQWSSDNYLRKYKANDSSQILISNRIYETQRCNQVHNYKLGYSYKLFAKTDIGISLFGYYDKRTNKSNNENEVFKNTNPIYTINTNTANIPALLSNNINVNFSHTIDTANSAVTVATQYGSFVANQLATIQQAIIIKGFDAIQDIKRSKNKNVITIKSVAVNYNATLSKTLKIESGLKESNISKKSSIGLDNFINNNWSADNSYTNSFTFSENIAAFYTNFIWHNKKINGRLGGRAEHTNSLGKSDLLPGNIIDKKYIDFFQSVQIGYDFSKDFTTSLSYTSRINRPTFQDLDPFITYIDSITSFRGNPYLQPEYTKSIEALFVYMKEANITLGYNKTNGAIRLVVNKINNFSEAFIASSQNIDKSHSYYASATIPYELKWWTTSNYFGYFVNSYIYNQNGETIKNLQPTVSVYLYNEFRYKEFISSEITYEYTSAAVDGIFVTEPFSAFSISLKKQFLKNKLTCRVVANDIFSRYKTAGRSNIPLYNVTFDSRIGMHYFLFALNYKFGKLKSDKNTIQSVNDEELKRIKLGK